MSEVTKRVDAAGATGNDIIELSRKVCRTLGDAETEREAERTEAAKRQKATLEAAAARFEQEKKRLVEQSSWIDGLVSETRDLLHERSSDPTFRNLLDRFDHAKPYRADGSGGHEKRARQWIDELKAEPVRSNSGCLLAFLGIVAFAAMFTLCGLVFEATVHPDPHKSYPAVTTIVFVLAGAAAIGFPTWFALRKRSRHYPRVDNLAGVLGALRTSNALQRGNADRGHGEEAGNAQAAFNAALTTADGRCRAKFADSRPMIDYLCHQANILAPPMADPRWRSVSLDSSSSWVPRLGEQRFVLADHEVRVPFLQPFPMRRPIVIRSDGRDLGTTTTAVQQLMLRLAVSVSPGKLRFTFLDPVGLGHNAAPLLSLGDQGNSDLITGRAWSEPAHIEQRLADLTEHVENVIQKYLRNEFATIEEYNARAGEVTEAYRVVVAFNVPTNFSEVSFRRLVSLAQNGARCGVFVIAVIDPAAKPPYGVSLQDLERSALVLAKDGAGSWRCNDPDFKGAVVWEGGVDMGVADAWLHAVSSAAASVGPVQVAFDQITPPESEWWTSDSRKGVQAPLGPRGARETQYLELGKGTAQHMLIAGKPGSGKSTLLHVFITGLALAYSPDELELYLVDFKKGVEFKPYAEHQLPHARVVAVESEREFGVSVLQGLDDELTRRGDSFRSAGVNEISSFRDATGNSLPRIVLIVDEFQEFFTEDDAIASRSAQILDRLVRQGRAFGIHIALGSQTLGGAYTLAKSTMDQMHVRIALQCSETDSRLILADDNPAARLLARPGEAIYNAANGQVEGNQNFQVAWLDEHQRNERLERLRHRARGTNPRRTIVFEGNAPAEISENDKLRDVVEAGDSVTGPPRAWIGDPIAIADPVAVRFSRVAGSNLLIVGRDGPITVGIASSVVCSLAAADIEEMSVVDFGVDEDVDGGSETPGLAVLVGQLGGVVKNVGRRQLPRLLASIAQEVDERTEREDYRAPARFLMVHGLHRARDLRVEESGNFGFSLEAESPETTSAQHFSSIIKRGPEVGIHVITWCDTARNVGRAIDRKTIQEFGARVVLQMSSDESTSLIDTPAASKLGTNRALFLDEDQARLVKFRPYGPPRNLWITELADRLHAPDRVRPLFPSPGG